MAAGGLLCACLALVSLAIPLIAADDRPVAMAHFSVAAPPAPAPALVPTIPELVFTLAPVPTGGAQAAVDAAQATAASTTELGVAVQDRVTGETAVGTRGTEPFYTASLSKLVLAVDVLDRRRTEGWSSPTRTSAWSGARSGPATTPR